MAFEQTVRILRDSVGAPKFQQLHARVAKRALAQHLAQTQDKPEVVRYVDGREGAPEESVRLYGVIRYEFIRLAAIAQAGLELARQLSPVQSGKYRDSWFLMVDGREVDRVPHGAREVVLTNDQPYHRKLEMTVNQTGLKVTVRHPPGIVEKVRQQLFRRYGQSFDAQITFIRLDGGYVLKGRGRTAAAKQNRMSSAYRAGRAKTAVKADRRAGQEMTYPALILRPF